MLPHERVEMGKYLRHSRLVAKLTQAEVARKLGFSSSQFVSNIERGTQSVPLFTLARLIRIYKLDGKRAVQILLGGQEKMLMKAIKR